MRVNRAEFKAIRALAKQKAEKRAIKRSTLPWAARKRKKGPDPRKTAFARLKASCKLFVLLRAKHRTAGMCEVRVLCGGENYAKLAYHIIPAATGNAIKYDDRNLVGACSQCNGGEYFDRKRGTYERWEVRHKELLGEVHTELKAAAGREQIPTHKAMSMAAEYERKIASGEFK